MKKKPKKPSKKKISKREQEAEDFWRQQLAKAEYEKNAFIRERGW